MELWKQEERMTGEINDKLRKNVKKTERKRCSYKDQKKRESTK